ncbi:thioredoxin family protein [Niastella vici]|uniref:thioredoxin family protein n=1 Tax=Niastella vici TaxID=1703345 RepID=UPI0009BCEB3E|nr:thioredoxin family protein [Niastella vici]
MPQYTKPVQRNRGSRLLRRNFNHLLTYSAIPIFLFLMLPGLTAPVAAQETGVHFEHNLSWAEVQAKAKAANKYIFMDCFTTWCGPCKYMRTTIFPQQEMGNFINDKFISVEVQLDTTGKDDDHVKSWYADAHAIMTQYAIKAFPTYLIFAPDGRVLHRIVGGNSVKGFIGELQESFDTTKQYYTKLKQFENGRRDSAFLRQFAIQVSDAYDLPLGKKVAKAYLAGQTNLFTPAALDLINLYTTRSSDQYFDFLAKNATKIDGVIGAGKTEKKIRTIFLNEGARIRWDDKNATAWKNYQKKIAATLPAEANEITLRINVNFYRGKRDWPNFEKAIGSYLKQYSKQMTDDELNSIAWNIFETCPDMNCVSKILDWSSPLKNSKEPAFLDTYANLLYKLGKKEEAIAMEQKAVDLSPENDRAANQATLDKMKKGEKTWN